MKARLPESLLGRGTSEHPPQSMSEASATGSPMKTARPEYFMRSSDRMPSEMSDSALLLISRRVFQRIIPNITISCRRIDETVAVLFYIHWLEQQVFVTRLLGGFRLN